MFRGPHVTGIVTIINISETTTAHHELFDEINLFKRRRCIPNSNQII